MENVENGNSNTPVGHDVEKEKKLVRKLDCVILPWVMLMYLLSYMDRSNLGNVREIGLEQDLELTPTLYEWASATFYIGTVLFGTIGGLMLKVVPPSTWLAGCLMGWGAVSTLQASCTNAAGLIALRFFLGVFEASFAPGCALYLSFWYLKSELSLRIAAYAGMSALSGVISGLVAYGLGSADGLLIESWQAVFIIEGLPTVLCGVLTFWILPGRPEAGRSHWFSEDEYQIILQRRTRFVRNQDDGIKLSQVKGAFLDYRLYLFAFIYSGLSLSLAVMSVFLPTIVATLGYESVQANLMTAPAYASAYICLLLTAHLSDRTRLRGAPVAVGGFIAGTGYVLLGLLHEHRARYASAFLAVVGTYMAYPIVLAWIPSTFGGDTKSGVGVGVVIAVGHAVGIAASYIYPKNQAPQYFMGNVVSSVLTFTTAVAAIAMSLLLYLENRSKDRRYGKPEVDCSIDMGADADGNPSYRYDI
ncbi:putative transporter [Lasiodiplodia theobromae]|uniref:Putative transporter n=1 Tax=Lasiodiplodia theobromae TaxID=45133 RepID=A0A5N5CTL1_9PEZI|nr:putative transporter [Lasiodiplodia theobromae]